MTLRDRETLEQDAVPADRAGRRAPAPPRGGGGGGVGAEGGGRRRGGVESGGSGGVRGWGGGAAPPPRGGGGVCGRGGSAVARASPSGRAAACGGSGPRRGGGEGGGAGAELAPRAAGGRCARRSRGPPPRPSRDPRAPGCRTRRRARTGSRPPPRASASSRITPSRSFVRSPRRGARATTVQLGHLRADLLTVARRAQHLVDHRLAAGVVLEVLLEADHERVHDLLDPERLGEPLLHLALAHLASWRTTSTSSRSFDPK